VDLDPSGLIALPRNSPRRIDGRPRPSFVCCLSLSESLRFGVGSEPSGVTSVRGTTTFCRRFRTPLSGPALPLLSKGGGGARKRREKPRKNAHRKKIRGSYRAPYGIETRARKRFLRRTVASGDFSVLAILLKFS
jgi:hypothetical protein